MKSFTGGMILGGVVGAMLSKMLSGKRRNYKNIMRTGRNVLKRSGRFLADITDIIR